MRIALLLILVLASLGVVRIARAESPFTVHGWLVHDPDIDYVKSCIDRAKEFHINHIQLSHDIIHHGHEVLEDEKKRDIVETLAAYAKSKGVRNYIWTHEMEEVPKELMNSDRNLDLDNPKVWTWLKDKYNKIFDAVPSTDGLILTFHETQISVYNDAKCASKLSHPDRVTKLIAEMYEICKARGKELIVRDFVYRPDELEWVARGIHHSPKEVGLMSKCVPHDWHPFYPKNPSIGQFPERLHITELDIGDEYYGQSIVPMVQPEYIQEHLKHARDKGLQGGVARIDRHSNHAFGTPNEVNIIAWSRFLDNPDEDINKVWTEAVQQVYGAGRAEDIVKILKRTWDINTKMYLTKQFYFLNTHSAIPDLGYAEGHVTSHSIAKWDPAFKSVEEELLNPTEDTYREVMAEKQEAINLARECLVDIERIKSGTEDVVYDSLKYHLEKSYRCAVLWKGMTDSYFTYQLWKKDKSEENQKRCEKALKDFATVADQVEKQVGPDAQFDSAKRAKAFIAEIQGKLDN